MVEQLWSALFPTLPYEGRVNQRWREVGFQVPSRLFFPPKNLLTVYS
jgi:hypothetical protein